MFPQHKGAAHEYCQGNDPVAVILVASLVIRKHLSQE
jgi:hypothetical protein